jgi:hypothetical protein
VSRAMRIVGAYIEVAAANDEPYAAIAGWQR